MHFQRGVILELQATSLLTRFWNAFQKTEEDVEKAENRKNADHVCAE